MKDALKPPQREEVDAWKAMVANQTRKIRPSRLKKGELAETWAMVKAILAHIVEILKQTSFRLRLPAPYFYPDYPADFLFKLARLRPKQRAGI